MSCKTAFVLILASCFAFSLTGCQAGKMNMQSLAFWKKDDKLDSRYIEPPSHQLNPSDTQLAVSDDDSLPPLPPDINRTADKFESEVTKSYQQLAEQTKEAEKRFSDSLASVEKQTRAGLNQLPTRPSYSSTTSEPEPNFSNPLTPKPVNRSRPNTQVAQTSVDAMPPSSGAFQPRTTSTPSLPKSPVTQNPGMTEYEKLAQSENGGGSGRFQPRNSPKASNQLASNGNATMPKIQYPTSNSPLKPNDRLASTTVNNPYSTRPKSDLSLQPIARNQPANTSPQSNDAQQVNYEYPSTPYESYRSPNTDSSRQQEFASAESSTSTSPLKPSSAQTPPSSAPKSATGLKLDLAGQGSYAPGSVRRPKALNPSELKLPTSTTASSTNESGGAFKR